MNIESIKSVYFVGIGGIGMSALARYFNDHGALVYGYDKTETPLTKTLVSEGMNIQYVDDPDLVPDQLDLVVYTPAIPKSNQVFQYLQSKNYPFYKRAQVLGLIVNSGECFAVAGSHGKSTTSAMLEHVMQVSGRNCTGFLGAISANYQSNYIKGCSDCFVVEADEFDRSFLQIKPTATIVTSVDSDHLDIYGSMEGVTEGFLTYLAGVRDNGKIVIQMDQEIIEKLDSSKVITYGLHSGATYYAQSINQIQGGFEFQVVGPKGLISSFQLRMGGLYNIENAVGVIALSTEYGISGEDLSRAFQSFKGLKRRFEYVLDTPKITLIDDYAHHPHEIRSFIEGVRELYPNKRIAIIFQPHLYSRTQDYYKHFAESLDLGDEVLIMPIYPAREEPIEGVSSELILNEMKNKNAQLVDFDTVIDAAKNLDVDVIATVGAGDISKIVEPLKASLENE